MCCTVAAAGHEVHLVVPRGDVPSVEVHKGVTIHSVPLPQTRRQRMYGTVKRVLEVAAEIQGDIYQFHDPEILIQAVAFQEQVGRPVVFDSHEDYRLQMLYKPWLPRALRPLVGRAVGWYEDRNVGKLAGVVAATPSIAERFSSHANCVVVQNFPILQELAIDDDQIQDRCQGLFGYVGGLVAVRGLQEMIRALPLAGTDIRLELGGGWSSDDFRAKCAALPGWPQVSDLGFLDRDQVRDMFRRVSAGLVLIHPAQSYLTAYPVKMFEYMAAGLPVIASNFELWTSIVVGNRCGLVVDPLDEQAIGAAMRQLADDPTGAQEMGRQGRLAIETQYNWEKELIRLLDFYESLTA